MALLLDLLDRHDDERVHRAIAASQAEHADTTDASAAALLAVLRSSGVVDVDAAADPRWLALRPAHRAALLLLEVEQIPLARAAQLLWLRPDQMASAYRGACGALGWEPLEPVPCAGWPTVARMHRVGSEDGVVAIIHLTHCVRCGVWQIERQQRRTHLAEIAPFVGATGLGFRWDPASI